MMITVGTAVGVTQALENILSDAPAEDQTTENVDIVASVLSGILALGNQITGEVCTVKAPELIFKQHFIVRQGIYICNYVTLLVF